MYQEWLNENVPRRLSLSIKFLNLISLNTFVRDYPEVVSKFKLLIYIDYKDDDLFKALQAVCTSFPFPSPLAIDREANAVAEDYGLWKF